MRESLQGTCLASLLILGVNCLESPIREPGPEGTGAGFVKPVSPSSTVPCPAPPVPTAPGLPPPASVSPPPSLAGSSSQASSAPLAEPQSSIGSRTSEEEKQLEQLFDRADQLLELLETGSLEEAAREIDRLPAAFSGCDAVSAVEEILRRRLHRAMAAVGTKPSVAAGRRERRTEETGEARSPSGDGRGTAAVEQLEAAWAKDPGNPEVSGALADLLKKVGLEHYSKGDTSRAVSCWERALDVRPGDPETLRFLERASAVNRKL